MKKLAETENLRQREPKQELIEQKKELKAYMHTPGAKRKLPADKDMNNQKLTQIKEALHTNGEIDPAYRLNEKYRKRIEGKTPE